MNKSKNTTSKKAKVTDRSVERLQPVTKVKTKRIIIQEEYKPKQREIYRTFRGKKIPVTLENFCECYPWEQIEYTLPKREYKQFCDWMRGQTCPIGGVYSWDFKRWFMKLPCID